MGKEEYLTRSEAADFLKSRGYPGTKLTLAKLACIGGGPKFRKFGNRTLYTKVDLQAWAEDRAGEPVSSTSEFSQKKVVSIGPRRYFNYDAQAQREMSAYSKFLVESGLQHHDVYADVIPEAHCLVSVHHSACNYGAELSYSMETEDAESLRRFVGALEEVKHIALMRLSELADSD